MELSLSELKPKAPTSKQKRTKYGEACSAQCFTFVPLVVESYGGIGRDFLKFMEDIITAHAQGRGREGNPRAVRDREMRRVAVGVAEYPPNARAADALIDWICFPGQYMLQVGPATGNFAGCYPCFAGYFGTAPNHTSPACEAACQPRSRARRCFKGEARAPLAIEARRLRWVAY